MTRYEQLRRYLEDITASVSEGVFLLENESARRTLLAIVRDLQTLDDLLEIWHPLNEP